MGTTPLRRFLQSLCNNSCWNYAVFWRLQQQSQILLMWEDGYFDTMKVQDSMEDLFAETMFRNIEETSSHNTYNGSSGGDAVETAVAYMSTFQYALGEGVVGDVAYTGNSHWIYANTPVPEHPDEWLFQFAAGVKTILLLPVTPHGVLQLGSLQHLPEDAQMSNYIKNEFFTHQDFMSYSDTFSTNQQFPFPSQSSSSFMMQSFNEFPSFMENNNKSSDEVNWSNHNGPIISDVGPFLSFPKECELHKALGPAFMGPTDDSFQNLSIGDDSKSESKSKSKTNGMVFYNENVESLLGNMNPCIQTSGESSLSNSFGQFTSLTKRKNINENENGGFEGESSVFINDHLVPGVLSRVTSHNDSCSPSAISYEGVGDVVKEEEEQKSKGAKPSIANKKRGKPGSKQKARPRDRQLIQDRLKDLRELVPDGAKCSIDGLLDRTVKHMLFLKSVGDRASKLRQCVQPEGEGSIQTNDITSEEKGGKNGASWAFELGGDLKVCPIIVEDLQYPGHMIIEMICDESSRFLEIAEVIHGLDLTILNGGTQRRSDNTWARYIVEAPRGFHRLDIFWPLMKLLQQQQHSPISSKI
ncbi:unnamed protein product [Lactuca virosa]|uniref:BHLH domain-containing protein n=1 Tax=Lactuca virosa TaxID=75947 RepID=A0AAU9NPL1_9ASTR|nr:unnamed protein product [Lactuca virosa]